MAKKRDEVYVDIIAETKKSIAGIAKFTLAIGGAVIAIRKINAVAMDMVRAFFEAEKAELKLTSALRSTGYAIGITTSEMKIMADELANLTSIEDDTIIAAEGLMVTFTKIGKKVFPAALEAAADMSVMFGQDLQQSVIQLGTALNDPIMGVGRLRRIGISFTQEQKDMIKGFVEANDVMSAQAVILDELNVEFGGIAKAMGDTAFGAVQKLKNEFGNLKEEIGELLAGTELIDTFTAITVKWKDYIAAIKDSNKLIEAEGQLLKDRIAGVLTFEKDYTRIANLQQTTLQAIDYFTQRDLEHEKDSLKLLKEILVTFDAQLTIWGPLHNKQVAANELQRLLNEGEKIHAQYIGITITDLEKEIQAYELLKSQMDQHLEGLRASPEILLLERIKLIEIKLEIEKIIEAKKEELQLSEKITFSLISEGELFKRNMEERKRLISEIAETERAARDEAKEKAEGLKAEISELASAMRPFANAFMGMFEALGKGWEGFAEAGKQAIIAIVRALGEMALVEALEALARGILGDVKAFGAAAAFGVAAAAAFAGAGIIASLGEGGIVTKPTMALIGEKGPEAVIPLGKGGAGVTVIVQGSVIAEAELDARIGAAVGRLGRGY